MWTNLGVIFGFKRCLHFGRLIGTPCLEVRRVKCEICLMGHVITRLFNQLTKRAYCWKRGSKEQKLDFLLLIPRPNWSLANSTKTALKSYFSENWEIRESEKPFRKLKLQALTDGWASFNLFCRFNKFFFFLWLGQKIPRMAFVKVQVSLSEAVAKVSYFWCRLLQCPNLVMTFLILLVHF